MGELISCKSARTDSFNRHPNRVSARVRRWSGRPRVEFNTVFLPVASDLFWSKTGFRAIFSA